MSLFKKQFIASSIATIMTMMFFTVASANNTSNIIRESPLMGDGTWQMRIERLIGNPMALLITAIGILIIYLVVARFGMTLLYLTNPEFFDKIDNFQKSKLNINLKGASPGDWISYIGSLFIPNIKSLSDYANSDGQLDTNIVAYLKKSGPKIIGLVVAGTLFFGGQVRDIMAMTTDFGIFVGNSIAGFDVVGKVQHWINDGERADYIYGDNLEGRNKHKIALEIDRALRGMNSRQNSTEFYQAVGQFTTRMTDEVATTLFPTDVPVGAARTFKVTANVKTYRDEIGSIPNVGVYQVTDDTGYLLRNLTGERFLTVAISDVVEAHNSEIGDITTGNVAWDRNHFPSVSHWNNGQDINSGSTITISIPQGYEITNAGTNINVDITVKRAGETQDVVYRGSVRTTRNAINIPKASFTEVGNSNNRMSSATITSLTFSLGDSIRIEPQDESNPPEIRFPYSGQSFRYNR